MQTMPVPPVKPHKRLPRWPIYAVVIILAYVVIALLRPIPDITPNRTTGSLRITTQPSNLPWPDYGESAVGLVGGGVIGTHGSQNPVPIASIAKVLTALTVLKKYPLSGGEAGPTITLDATDVGFYNSYKTIGGSVVAVQAGEQISEQQLLEGMLLPSGNNMADSLARWAYGSVSNYDTAANQYASQLGLTLTHAATDASGFSPNTTSTASDLVKLGILAMQNPALAQIVAKPSVVLPIAGTVSNRNTLLGSDEIVGIKTGNNDQDAGAFLGAAAVAVNGVTTTIVTAETGAGSLEQALENSMPLIDAARHNFASTTLVQAGEVLGTYQQPWGGTIQALAAKNLSITTLQGDTAAAKFGLESITTNAKAGQTVGTLTAPKSTFNPAESVPITLHQTPTLPSLRWRLFHAF